MSKRIDEFDSPMENGVGYWAVEEESGSRFPVSDARDKAYVPVVKPTAPASATSNAMPSGSTRPTGTTTGVVIPDYPKEVSPGVLADGSWTSAHPLVQRYIGRVRDRYGASIEADLLDTFPPPSDLRVYALVALQVGNFPETPAFWIFWHAKQWKKSIEIIRSQSKKRTIWAWFMEDGWDTRVLGMHINCGHLVPDDEWVLKSERQKKENARKAAAAKRKLEEAGDASSAPAKKRPRKAPRLTHIKTHKPAKKAEQPEPAPAAEGDHAEATSHPNNNGVIATLGDEAPAPPKLALTKASRKIVKESAKPTRVSARIQEKKAAAVVEEENDNRGEPELPPVAAAGTGTAGTVVNPSIKRSSRVTASNTKVAVTAGGSDASGTNPLPRMTKEPETRELANAQPAGRKAPADRSSKPSVVLLRKSKTESTVKAHAEKAQVQHKKTAATVDDRDATTAAVVTGASKRFGKTANAEREDGKAPTDPSSKAKVTLLLGTKDASAPQADAEQAKPALPSTRARKARKSDENAQVTISAGSTKKEAVLLPVENGGPVPMTAEEDGKPSEAQAVPSRPQRTRRQSQKALESAAQAPKRRQGGKRLAAVAASDELK